MILYFTKTAKKTIFNPQISQLLYLDLAALVVF